MSTLAEAFAAVPRIGFLPSNQRRFVRRDGALPIGYGVTNSQPSTVRNMLELLDVHPGHRVLDVGAGSGWTTALLARLVGPEGRVVAVERIPQVLEFGRANVAAADPPAPVELHLALTGTLGWPDAAPYDRILVSADASEVPEALVDQLAPAGVMVLPVRSEMLRVVRAAGGEPEVERHGRYTFVPLIDE
jgi:protein-L-isoaspartate(D-aspartate) O-methyltransferase